MRFPVICLITGGEGGIPGLVREAASAGVDLIQIREPHMPGGALVSYTRQAVGDAAGTPCRVLVNDRLDVAVAARAGGVHLRGDSFPAARVRSAAPGGFIIGRSVHSAAEAAAVADGGGCDYLIFGAVFQSTNKPAGHPTAGLAGLREVCRATTLPVIAVGGISIDNVGAVIAAGARGVAAISLFRGAAMSSTISTIRQQFDTSSRVV